jgi:hypothetical protein
MIQPSSEVLDKLEFLLHHLLHDDMAYAVRALRNQNLALQALLDEEEDLEDEEDSD